MSDNNNNAKTMYEAVPAAAELNKVPGFDPLKFLRRAGDSMKLDLPYQKLWFRMAHPNGRMRLTAMRITEQMAIFEAKVFLDRSDAEPFSVSVAQQTMQDSRDFVKAAQNEALSQALSDAGFGIQLVSADTHAASVQKAAPVSKTQPSAITPPVSTVLPQEPSAPRRRPLFFPRVIPFPGAHKRHRGHLKTQKQQERRFSLQQLRPMSRVCR